MNTRVCIFLLLGLSVITSCGYRSLHWKLPVEGADRSFLDSSLCAQEIVQDSSVVICPATATNVKTLLQGEQARLKGVFMFSSDCDGFCKVLRRG